MQKMILWTIVLFTPLLWTTTTHAIFGLPGIVTLIVLGRKVPHGFPFRRPHSRFPIH